MAILCLQSSKRSRITSHVWAEKTHPKTSPGWFLKSFLNLSPSESTSPRCSKHPCFFPVPVFIRDPRNQRWHQGTLVELDNLLVGRKSRKFPHTTQKGDWLVQNPQCKYRFFVEDMFWLRLDSQAIMGNQSGPVYLYMSRTFKSPHMKASTFNFRIGILGSFTRRWPSTWIKIEKDILKVGAGIFLEVKRKCTQTLLSHGI